MSETLRIVVRLRPITAKERDKVIESVATGNETTVIITESAKIRQLYPPWIGSRISSSRKQHQFSFNKVFYQQSTQAEIFQEVGRPLLANVLQGYNACLIAYGQTGSGKTHTIFGSDDDPGLAFRLCEALLKEKATSKQNFNIQLSFLEIHTEMMKDLVSSKDSINGHRRPRKRDQKLKIREHPQHGPYVEGLTLHKTSTVFDACSLLNRGIESRKQAVTAVHDHSSRSHAIFTLHVTTDPEGYSGSKALFAKLTLVDLAGSERNQPSCSKQRQSEAASINKSLASLSNVIRALSKQSIIGDDFCRTQTGRIQLYVPYRDSLLTWLLKDSLGGNSKTTMVATISPTEASYRESLSTLRYASRASCIRTCPVINQDRDKQLIRVLRNEIARLSAIVSNNNNCEICQQCLVTSKRSSTSCCWLQSCTRTVDKNGHTVVYTTRSVMTSPIPEFPGLNRNSNSKKATRQKSNNRTKELGTKTMKSLTNGELILNGDGPTETEQNGIYVDDQETLSGTADAVTDVISDRHKQRFLGAQEVTTTTNLERKPASIQQEDLLRRELQQNTTTREVHASFSSSISTNGGVEGSEETLPKNHNRSVILRAHATEKEEKAFFLAMTESDGPSEFFTEQHELVESLNDDEELEAQLLQINHMKRKSRSESSDWGKISDLEVDASADASKISELFQQYTAVALSRIAEANANSSVSSLDSPLTVTRSQKFKAEDHLFQESLLTTTTTSSFENSVQSQRRNLQGKFESSLDSSSEASSTSPRVPGKQKRIRRRHTVSTGSLLARPNLSASVSASTERKQFRQRKRRALTASTESSESAMLSRSTRCLASTKQWLDSINYNGKLDNAEDPTTMLNDIDNANDLTEDADKLRPIQIRELSFDSIDSPQRISDTMDPYPKDPKLVDFWRRSQDNPNLALVHNDALSSSQSSSFLQSVIPPPLCLSLTSDHEHLHNSQDSLEEYLAEAATKSELKQRQSLEEQLMSDGTPVSYRRDLQEFLNSSAATGGLEDSLSSPVNATNPFEFNHQFQSPSISVAAIEEHNKKTFLNSDRSSSLDSMHLSSRNLLKKRQRPGAYSKAFSSFTASDSLELSESPEAVASSTNTLSINVRGLPPRQLSLNSNAELETALSAPKSWSNATTTTITNDIDNAAELLDGEVEMILRTGSSPEQELLNRRMASLSHSSDSSSSDDEHNRKAAEDEAGYQSSFESSDSEENDKDETRKLDQSSVGLLPVAPFTKRLQTFYAPSETASICSARIITDEEMDTGEETSAMRGESPLLLDPMFEVHATNNHNDKAETLSEFCEQSNKQSGINSSVPKSIGTADYIANNAGQNTAASSSSFMRMLATAEAAPERDAMETERVETEATNKLSIKQHCNNLSAHENRTQQMIANEFATTEAGANNCSGSFESTQIIVASQSQEHGEPSSNEDLRRRSFSNTKAIKEVLKLVVKKSVEISDEDLQRRLSSEGEKRQLSNQPSNELQIPGGAYHYKSVASDKRSSAGSSQCASFESDDVFPFTLRPSMNHMLASALEEPPDDNTDTENESVSVLAESSLESSDRQMSPSKEAKLVYSWVNNPEVPTATMDVLQPYETAADFVGDVVMKSGMAENSPHVVEVLDENYQEQNAVNIQLIEGASRVVSKPISVALLAKAEAAAMSKPSSPVGSLLGKRANSLSDGSTSSSMGFSSSLLQRGLSLPVSNKVAAAEKQQQQQLIGDVAENVAESIVALVQSASESVEVSASASAAGSGRSSRIEARLTEAAIDERLASTGEDEDDMSHFDATNSRQSLATDSFDSLFEEGEALPRKNTQPLLLIQAINVRKLQLNYSSNNEQGQQQQRETWNESQEPNSYTDLFSSEATGALSNGYGRMDNAGLLSKSSASPKTVISALRPAFRSTPEMLSDIGSANSADENSSDGWFSFNQTEKNSTVNDDQKSPATASNIVVDVVEVDNDFRFVVTLPSIDQDPAAVITSITDREQVTSGSTSDDESTPNAAGILMLSDSTEESEKFLVLQPLSINATTNKEHDEDSDHKIADSESEENILAESTINEDQTMSITSHSRNTLQSADSQDYGNAPEHYQKLGSIEDMENSEQTCSECSAWNQLFDTHQNWYISKAFDKANNNGSLRPEAATVSPCSKCSSMERTSFIPVWHQTANVQENGVKLDPNSNISDDGRLQEFLQSFLTENDVSERMEKFLQSVSAEDGKQNGKKSDSLSAETSQSPTEAAIDLDLRREMDALNNTETKLALSQSLSLENATFECAFPVWNAPDQPTLAISAVSWHGHHLLNAFQITQNTGFVEPPTLTILSYERSGTIELEEVTEESSRSNDLLQNNEADELATTAIVPFNDYNGVAEERDIVQIDDLSVDVTETNLTEKEEQELVPEENGHHELETSQFLVETAVEALSVDEGIVETVLHEVPTESRANAYVKIDEEIFDLEHSSDEEEHADGSVKELHSDILLRPAALQKNFSVVIEYSEGEDNDDRDPKKTFLNFSDVLRLGPEGLKNYDAGNTTQQQQQEQNELEPQQQHPAVLSPTSITIQSSMYAEIDEDSDSEQELPQPTTTIDSEQLLPKNPGTVENQNNNDNEALDTVADFERETREDSYDITVEDITYDDYSITKLHDTSLEITECIPGQILDSSNTVLQEVDSEPEVNKSTDNVRSNHASRIPILTNVNYVTFTDSITELPPSTSSDTLHHRPRPTSVPIKTPALNPFLQGSAEDSRILTKKASNNRSKDYSESEEDDDKDVSSDDSGGFKKSVRWRDSRGSPLEQGPTEAKPAENISPRSIIKQAKERYEAFRNGQFAHLQDSIDLSSKSRQLKRTSALSSDQDIVEMLQKLQKSQDVIEATIQSFMSSNNFNDRLQNLQRTPITTTILEEQEGTPTTPSAKDMPVVATVSGTVSSSAQASTLRVDAAVQTDDIAVYQHEMHHSARHLPSTSTAQNVDMLHNTSSSPSLYTIRHRLADLFRERSMLSDIINNTPEIDDIDSEYPATITAMVSNAPLPLTLTASYLSEYRRKLLKKKLTLDQKVTELSALLGDCPRHDFETSLSLDAERHFDADATRARFNFAYRPSPLSSIILRHSTVERTRPTSAARVGLVEYQRQLMEIRRSIVAAARDRSIYAVPDTVPSFSGAYSGRQQWHADDMTKETLDKDIDKELTRLRQKYVAVLERLGKPEQPNRPKVVKQTEI